MTRVNRKRFILDNNAFTGITKNNPVIVRRLLLVPPEDVYLSIVAAREAMRGIAEVIGANEKKARKVCRGRMCIYRY